MTCPPHDRHICGKPQPDGFPQSMCATYDNVKEDCPFMCGICKGKQKACEMIRNFTVLFCKIDLLHVFYTLRKQLWILLIKGLQ